MTKAESRARELLLARYARYNASSKGRVRRQRYEEKHPERQLGRNPIMRKRAVRYAEGGWNANLPD